MLSKTTGKGYAPVRKQFIEKSNEIDESNFPTLHILTKSRPEMDRLALEKEPPLDGDLSKEQEEDNGFCIDNNAALLAVNQPTTAHALATSSSSQYADDDAAAVAQSHKEEDNKIVGSKMKGNY